MKPRSRSLDKVQIARLVMWSVLKTRKSCALNFHFMAGTNHQHKHNTTPGQAPNGAADAKDPSGFLSEIIGAPVTVKLNSGVVYKGRFRLLNSMYIYTAYLLSV